MITENLLQRLREQSDKLTVERILSLIGELIAEQQAIIEATRERVSMAATYLYTNARQLLARHGNDERIDARAFDEILRQQQNDRDSAEAEQSRAYGELRAYERLMRRLLIFKGIGVNDNA